MIGYRNAAYDARSQEIEIFTWSEDGDRISYRTKFYPYIFLEDPKGEYLSIFNTKLKKKSFPNNYEKLKYIKETGVRRVFENFGAVHHCLIDIYHKHTETEDFSKFPIKIYYVDIECVEKNAMPDPNNPQTPINVITVYDNFTKTFYVWGLKPYTPKQSNVKYVYCKSEVDLLHKFIEFMKDDPCDVLSGWNSSFFDIPYIINRIHILLGEMAVGELSPIKRVYTRTFMGKFGKEQIQWQIDGVSCVDYLDIYKRFSFKNQESYKLDYIGEVELGEKKVDYGDRDLYDLMVEDWDLFVDYNIQDVNLLVKLEEKLQYISLLRMLANVGLTTLEGAMGTLGVITGSTAIRARLQGKHIPTFVRDPDTGEKNPGAYVADPTPGFQENVVTYDANSLYPNIMISLNMSPETKVGKIIDSDDEHVTIRHVNGQVFKLTKENFARFIKKDNIAVSKAKILFSQKTKGIIPELVDYYYQERKKVQSELRKCKVELSQKTDNANNVTVEELRTKIAQLDARQMSIKIFVNSVYGYFGNKQAPIGDDDIASSITLTGQAIIKKARDIGYEYVKNISNRQDLTLTEVGIYNDTDSCFFSLKHLPCKFVENKTVTKEAYEHVDRLGEILNSGIKLWCEKTFNSKDCRIVFKREKICDVGLFLEKKRYVVHILDEEGIVCDKWKYTGVEIARTTMPKAVKPFVKQIIETMLSTKSQSNTNAVLSKGYEVFNNLPLEDISITTGIKNYEKYSSQCNDFKVAKAMPNHVKASYFHNLLLDKLNASGKYEKISSGDKVKWYYVQQPNKYGVSSIAFKYKVPEEFKSLLQPDRELMFEKIVFSVVERFYTAVNWHPRKPSMQVQLELDDLFGN